MCWACLAFRLKSTTIKKIGCKPLIVFCGRKGKMVATHLRESGRTVVSLQMLIYHLVAAQTLVSL
jgi:hypothetical protein